MNVALALDAASGIYAVISLSLGWGPKRPSCSSPPTLTMTTFPYHGMSQADSSLSWSKDFVLALVSSATQPTMARSYRQPFSLWRIGMTHCSTRCRTCRRRTPLLLVDFYKSVELPGLVIF